MLCKGETDVRFSMTEMFTNRVGIVRLIFSWTAKQSVFLRLFLRIQVRASSQTEGLERG